MALALTGDPDAAANNSREAIAVLTELAREFPADARYSREVGFANALFTSWVAGVGNAQIWQPSIDRIDEAAHASHDAVTRFEALAARDPDDARAFGSRCGHRDRRCDHRSA